MEDKEKQNVIHFSQMKFKPYTQIVRIDFDKNKDVVKKVINYVIETLNNLSLSLSLIFIDEDEEFLDYVKKHDKEIEDLIQKSLGSDDELVRHKKTSFRINGKNYLICVTGNNKVEDAKFKIENITKDSIESSHKWFVDWLKEIIVNDHNWNSDNAKRVNGARNVFLFLLHLSFFFFLIRSDKGNSNVPTSYVFASGDIFDIIERHSSGNNSDKQEECGLRVTLRMKRDRIYVLVSRASKEQGKEGEQYSPVTKTFISSIDKRSKKGKKGKKKYDLSYKRFDNKIKEEWKHDIAYRYQRYVELFIFMLKEMGIQEPEWVTREINFTYASFKDLTYKLFEDEIIPFSIKYVGIDSNMREIIQEQIEKAVNEYTNSIGVVLENSFGMRKNAKDKMNVISIEKNNIGNLNTKRTLFDDNIDEQIEEEFKIEEEEEFDNNNKAIRLAIHCLGLMREKGYANFKECLEKEKKISIGNNRVIGEEDIDERTGIKVDNLLSGESGLFKTKMEFRPEQGIFFESLWNPKKNRIKEELPHVIRAALLDAKLKYYIYRTTLRKSEPFNFYISPLNKDINGDFVAFEVMLKKCGDYKASRVAVGLFRVSGNSVSLLWTKATPLAIREDNPSFSDIVNFLNSKDVRSSLSSLIGKENLQRVIALLERKSSDKLYNESFALVDIDGMEALNVLPVNPYTVRLFSTHTILDSNGKEKLDLHDMYSRSIKVTSYPGIVGCAKCAIRLCISDESRICLCFPIKGVRGKLPNDNRVREVQIFALKNGSFSVMKGSQVFDIKNGKSNSKVFSVYLNSHIFDTLVKSKVSKMSIFEKIMRIRIGLT